MNKMRLLLVIVLLLAATVGLQAQDDDMVSEFGAGEIELLFWNGLTGPDGETMVGLVKAFAEANPDVSVR
ncbi:MAG: hypothetical protein OXG23_01170, partial [Chloroflexi bacterium]|nr:hypothetical protein [Chloroflexota bacterium]